MFVILGWINVALWGAAFTLMIVNGRDGKRGKGKFSRWVLRRYGPFGMARFWMTMSGLAITNVVLLFVNRDASRCTTFCFWILFLAIEVDDWLHGDDDKWNRFKSWAKNKVKWKMALPREPVRVPTTA